MIDLYFYRLYLAVIYPESESGVQRSVNRTLLGTQSPPFPLTPLYTALDGSPAGLESLCAQWEGRTVVAALVLAGSGGLAAVGPALAARIAAVPMLWVGQAPFVQEPLGAHVIRVGPTEKELAQALRSLLVTSHWHSYSLLYAGPTEGLDPQKVKWLRAPPLNPTIYRMSPTSVNKRILHRLSHSSRGVIVVCADQHSVAGILRTATSLGMTDGNFVWIWVDTGASATLETSLTSLRRTRSTYKRRRQRGALYDRPKGISKLPVGLLALRAAVPPPDRHVIRASVRLMVDSMKKAANRVCSRLGVPTITRSQWKVATTCWARQPLEMGEFTKELVKELKRGAEYSLSGKGAPATNETSGQRSLSARFQILNLVPEQPEQFTQQQLLSMPKRVQESDNWKQVGEIIGCCDVRLERIIWPGGNIGGPCGGARTKIKVVTAVAAPFVMTSDAARGGGQTGGCLRGLPCQIVSDYNGTRYTYKVSCCYGLSMDLLEAVSQELDFDFQLYMVPDSMFGSRVVDPDAGTVRWTGVVGDLVSGNAHMAFTALSVSRPRIEVIDFSTPYYFSGVSFLAAPSQRTDIPLLAFLLPFSPELWIAIFSSLNVTAVAVAIYEWLSPFGLNPWGRQRTKNFSMSSALWVCWGLLCGHLVAFKAPKSWPNKFLINVWGGFSVIFVASYTANIAALIAGLFFHSATATYHDDSLLWQRVGSPKGSASEYYVHRANQLLWEHMQRFSVPDVATGVQYLKNGTLDILIADTPILDYYRATDQGCKLQKIGDAINEDTYAVGMTKGFPLKDSISAVISKFTSNGYMDILQEKWYGGLACFSMDTDMSQPKPLGVTAVAGVFLLLGLGVVMGLLILLVEHLFYRYTLPILRHKPKGTIWRSRNIMFFSQKLYRFINCVELVSPHHAARELVHTIRQGQITSLFQKSVKRKEHEQRRRRKSKAQFFEMIQEIRRVQQEEKQNSLILSDGGSLQSPRLRKSRSPQLLSPPDQQRRMSRLPTRLELARRFSKDVFRSKSSGNLDSRRLSSDINFAASRFLEAHSSQAIGRRLSRDTNLSPPDINSRRASHLVLTPELSIASNETLDDGSKSAYLQPPEIAVHPPVSPKKPDLPPPHPATPRHQPLAKRFSYVDTTSPSFRERISRFAEEKSRSSDEATTVEERKRNAPSLLEQINTMQDQFPVKPKIVSYVPKRSRRTISADTPSLSVEEPSSSGQTYVVPGSTATLDRLSRQELIQLSHIPENELKRRVIQALKDKAAS
ncbi:uncharacterized protein LOC106670874 isoform X1 [Cimex lectularius]|uniref:Glutamate [NMDA] receptor subunit 3A n=1 Tax=Cimex lectularius TaxID=79782 RepID=A0A8I6TKI0_CIMLE|nr:uncharacterized protein LOC106670874 isoform X1 [Cimex lectularius]